MMKIAVLAALLSPARAAIDGALVAKLKPTVVNIERSWTVGLNSEGSGRGRASGFIVDAARGIIATNHHVAGSGPSLFKIVFANGQSTDARLLHYDPWHDFAFLKVEPGRLGFPLREAALGDSFALREQDDVVMIGNNDVHEYSVKFGKVSNLVLEKGVRHSAAIQTTFDRAGGSSGSPVFDSRGRAVALHFAGTETTSFELKIDYLKDALVRLQAGAPVRRGDAGLELGLILVSDARKHFRLPEALARRVLALRPGLKYMISVGSRVPGTPASDKLLPGDQILSVDGAWVGDDLYRFDRIVDGKVGGEVEVRAVRAGEELTVRLPVRDAEALKATRFARFAGGVLQELTPELRLRHDLRSDGVFLSAAETGSSMSFLGRGRNERYLIVIEGVNGRPTPDLDAFIAATRGLRDREHAYFIVQDKNETKTDIKAVPVTLDLRYSPLEVWEWSPQKLDWVKTP
ncbi:MAG: trypsin-like peptidase domain-containing protein [Elusimicrobia bacterium]|nr:trypsin-like peptidase domain-containing protein [Elusimicrobiota bacterium]